MRRFALFLLVGLTMPHGGSMLAHATVPEEKLVVLQTRGVDDIVPEFADTLRELLSRIDMILITTEVRGRQASVSAYVDIEASERGAIVWVTDPRRVMPRLRREVPLDSSRDVFRETLAHVVFSAVEPYASAEVDDEPQVSEPIQGPEQVPTTVAPTLDSETPEAGTSAAKLLYELSARGGPLLVAKSLLAAQFGGAFRITLNRPLPASWSVEAAAMLPLSIDNDLMTADLQLASLRVIQRHAVFRTDQVRIELGISAGLDRWVFSPVRATPSIQLDDESRRLQPMAGVLAGLSVRLTRQLTLVLGTGIDLDAAPRRWVVATGTEQVTLLEPAHLRPYASLGLAWILNAQATVEGEQR
jgi:hypothetical protein